MSATDLTVKILCEIRDEIRNTNRRLDQTNERLEELTGRIDVTNERIDVTNERLDQTNGRLDKVEHALLDLAEQQRFVVRYVKSLAERDGHLDADVADLRSRVGVLEKQVGAKRR